MKGKNRKFSTKNDPVIAKKAHGIRKRNRMGQNSHCERKRKLRLKHAGVFRFPPGFLARFCSSLEENVV
ncbi:hypothetical protein B5F35_14565 [Anaeromassilibacillus sp. An200]|nr:hypothetical protein B5F35_14565 [Anaeromassilibacillus sp. An200]